MKAKIKSKYSIKKKDGFGGVTTKDLQAAAAETTLPATTKAKKKIVLKK